MKRMTVLICVLIFALIGCSKMDTAHDKAACHDVLKNSLQQVVDGKADPLGGSKPEPCKHLTKDVYDAVFWSVVNEVTNEVLHE